MLLLLLLLCCITSPVRAEDRISYDAKSTLAVLIHVQGSECWRPVALIRTLRSHGWVGDIALITDKEHFPWHEHVDDKVHLRFVESGGPRQAKTYKYRLFELFPEWNTFWYTDSDMLVMNDVGKLLRFVDTRRPALKREFMCITDHLPTEPFHTGTFFVHRNADTQRCFEGMAKRMAGATRMNRDQQNLNLLWDNEYHTCEVVPLPPSFMLFPSAQHLRELKTQGATFVHFTGVRRAGGTGTHEEHQAYWSHLGVGDLYMSEQLTC